jgi:hypothetical protein
MTTLDNRPNTALLVVDVQTGVVAGAHARDEVVANIADLVERARNEDIPVIWVRHEDDELAQGSEEWEIVAELKPSDAEKIIEKNYGVRGDEPRIGAVGSRYWSPRCRRRADRRVHPFDAARRIRARLRRDARQRRAHDRRSECVGGAAARRRDRTHEPVLEVP